MILLLSSPAPAAASPRAAAFQPLHQVVIPHIGLFVGEMRDLDELAADCAADVVYDLLLTAAPLPVTGAVGAPVNPVAIK